MKFLRLNEPLLTVLFEDEDIIAFDKPYGFNTHTNDSKVDHSDFIEDGLIEILEKQRGHRLHIIHRLDQTTTGVIIFGKSQESAKKYAAFFFDRKVKKTYWFITANQSTQPEFTIDAAIVHKGKELEAKTELRLKERSAKFELWEAKPFTGRNHQIRIHAKAAGVSILGDPKYDGREFFFLCLHNRRIEFPNDIVIESKPPFYFEDLTILEDHVLAKAFFEIDRRQRLFSQNMLQDENLRLVHPSGSGTENDFSIDHTAKFLVIQFFKEALNNKDLERFLFLVKALGKPALIRTGKIVSLLSVDRALTNDSGMPALEAPQVWISHEKDVKYELRADAGTATGISFNQRLQRRWVLENSAGKSVLSVFAQQGAYAVNAALGKATEVTGVESNKNLIAWAKKNLEINELKTESYKFLCRDSMVFLKQAATKHQKFDLVICEPPSFFRGEKGTFRIEKDLSALVKSCLQVVSEKGTLLLAINSESLLMGDLVSTLNAIKRELKIQFDVESIQSSFDFELPHEKTVLKSFLIRRL